MQQDTELQTFLPKSSFDSDTATVAGTTGPSRGQFTTRTKVEYWTIRRNHRFFNFPKRREAFFVFGPNDTVQEAAYHAAANYPVANDVPIFNDVYVFFKDLMKEIPVTDVHANVHSMFTADDTMIVSNTPKIFRAHRNSIIFGVSVFVGVSFCLMAAGIVALAYSTP